ncbi:M28 family metallopeptidase [Mesorhizobium sp. INR15]|uniref:M28 family metallopeptidase n=1 Tax=Mesorhizobium sp. INR15 TaxID=2654248 RepID=UPI0018967893|nr:M28 family peptidase [Mesorhizobium sp. INR15]QPC90752.1 M28 family peptidase [Mesorhizobium sp. INR15]
MPISSQEQHSLDQVGIDQEAWPLIERFSRLPREHPKDVDAGMDDVAARLASHGIPVTMHRPSLYLSLPGKARVECQGQTFRAKPPSFSVPVPNGFSAPLAYVAAKRTDGIDNIFDMKLQRGQDYSALAGKIVVTEGFASPGHISQFEAVGAAAVIAVNPGEDIHWGICTTIWGTPGLDELSGKPGIPAVAVNATAGRFLIEQAKAGEDATIFSELEEGWFESSLPVVEIKGTVEPEKFVLLHGHLDSWDVGIGDNAVGDATMLEIARVLWTSRHSLRRSVRIAWWPGHSTGRYAGSTWFADRFAIELERNCVAQINCDSPGCRWATEFLDLEAMPEAADFITGIIRDASPASELNIARPSRAGDYSFNNIGMTGYLMLSSNMPRQKQAELGYYDVGGCGSNIAWHTENDTIEIADREILLRDIKVYLLTVLRTANSELLPFDWRVTASEFAATIDGYQAKAGTHFDLAPASHAAAALKDCLNGFYARIDRAEVPAKIANDIIVALARILVPINFTRRPRFLHDPALSIPPLPSIAAAADLQITKPESMGFVVAQLVRGQNQLVSALNTAIEAIDLRLAQH